MLRQIKRTSHKHTTFLKSQLFYCALSSLLLILSFPNFNLEYVAWIAFLPLFAALRSASKTKALILSYLTGILFWAGAIYWLAHVTLLGAIILVVYLALYFALFGLMIRSINHQPRTINYFFIPAIWVILEYARSHLLTGFPWALLGYSQYLNLTVIQIAGITGAWGVSYLVMMVNVILWQGIMQVFVLKLPFSRLVRHLVSGILILAAVIGWGYYSLYKKQVIVKTPPIKVAVIQGNIPQDLKWDPEAREFIMERYIALSREASLEHPDLLLWPEAALPVVLEDNPFYFEIIADLARTLEIPILMGAVTSKGEEYYNSAVLISKEGSLRQQYNKLHLVPFGEYIPLRQVFPFLQSIAPIGDISRGETYTVFHTEEKFKLSALICFEDLPPELSRRFVKEGAQFLVNLTNDAWYKYSSAPYQHLQASVFRAVENNVFLVRSTNTGVSGFIDPKGRIVSLVKDKAGESIFVAGFTLYEIPYRESYMTWYTRFGDYFVVLCVLIVLCGIVASVMAKRKTVKTKD